MSELIKERLKQLIERLKYKNYKKKLFEKYLTSDLKTINVRIRKIIVHLMSLKTSNDEKQQIIQGNTTEIEELKRQNSDLTNEIEAKKTEISNTSSEIDRLNEEMQNLLTQLREKDRAYQDSIQEKERLEGDLASLERRANETIEEFNRRKAKLEQDLEEAEGLAETLNEEKLAIEKELREEKENYNKLKDEFNQLKEQYDMFTEEKETLNNQRLNLITENETLNKSVTENSVEIENYLDELDEISKENDDNPEIIKNINFIHNTLNDGLRGIDPIDTNKYYLHIFNIQKQYPELSDFIINVREQKINFIEFLKFLLKKLNDSINLNDQDKAVFFNEILKQIFVYFKIEDEEEEEEGVGGVSESKGGKRRNKKQYKAKGGMETDDSSEPDSGIFRDVDSVNGDEQEPTPRINIEELKVFIKSITQNDTFNKYVSKLDLSQLQGQNLTAATIFAKKQIEQKGNPLSKTRRQKAPSTTSTSSDFLNDAETGSSSSEGDLYGIGEPFNETVPSSDTLLSGTNPMHRKLATPSENIIKKPDNEEHKMGGGKHKTKKYKKKLINKGKITKKNKRKTITKKRKIKQKAGFTYEKTKSRSSLTTPVTKTSSNRSSSTSSRSRKSKR
jgi:hypothetical protein